MTDETSQPPELVTVKNVGLSVVDLEDGRTIGPGDDAESVNIAHPHNDRLALAGLIAVVSSTAPPEPDADATQEEK